MDAESDGGSGAGTTLDLTALAAAEIVARVHDGRSSAVEVARAHLARIAERDGTIGAFQEHDPQRVLAEAGGVDARADRFALPLAGVPVAIKDNVDVAGYPTRHGCAATSDAPARRDDELVKRLRAAGAVVMGKTRMPELAIWGFTASALGTTRNPLDETLDPGGSSGGTAAAVAAGMAALGLGTDGGGSIRIPSAYCGLVGLKPGRGLVPLPGGAEEHWYGLSVAGPIARTAQDAALMFEVLAAEAAGAGTDAGWPRRVALSLRVPVPFGRLDPAQRAAAVGAAARLRAGTGGAAVTVADPAYPPPTLWTRRWHAGVAREVAELGLALADLEPRTAAIVRKGRRVQRFTRPRPRAAAAWRDRVLAWLDEGGHDLLITPAVAGPPFPAGALQGRRYLPTLLQSAGRVPFTAAWNLAGLPSVVAPVLVDGRPIGVQLVGRPGEEYRLLAVAARLQGRAVPTGAPAPPGDPARWLPPAGAAPTADAVPTGAGGAVPGEPPGGRHAGRRRAARTRPEQLGDRRPVDEPGATAPSGDGRPAQARPETPPVQTGRDEALDSRGTRRADAVSRR